MTRTEDAILAVPMGNVGIRIKDIHRQKGLRSQSPRRARVQELQSVRGSRYLGTDSILQTRQTDRTGRLGRAGLRFGGGRCGGLPSNL